MNVVMAWLAQWNGTNTAQPEDSIIAAGCEQTDQGIRYQVEEVTRLPSLCGRGMTRGWQG